MQQQQKAAGKTAATPAQLISVCRINFTKKKK